MRRRCLHCDLPDRTVSFIFYSVLKRIIKNKNKREGGGREGGRDREVFI